jgi:hypothetical protein
MIISGINNMVVKAGFNIRLTSDVENGIHDWYMIVF